MSNSLAHHGIKGQKWGIRRYQNEDGTWTDAGKERYGDSASESSSAKTEGEQKKGSTGKKIAIGAAIVAGTVLTAYLVKKYGGKNVSTIANTASSGKTVAKDVLKNTSLATTPVSQLPAAKVEPKTVLKKALEASTSSTDISKTGTASAVNKASTVASKSTIANTVKNVSPASSSKPTASASKINTSAYDIPNSYDFETLLGQNNNLLNKMYEELLK